MKKQIISLVVALMLCLSLLPAVPATAADSDFIIENGVLIQYVGPGGDVVIPDGVTEIGRYFPMWVENGFGVSAFWDCSTITSIVMPDSVKTIPEDAFWGCTNLKSITLSNNLTEIPVNAFSMCSALSGIAIPDSVIKIGDYAFSGCTQLENVYVANPDTQVTANAFFLCGKLESINIAGEQASIDSISGKDNNQNQNQNTNQNQNQTNNRPAEQTRQEKAQAEWDRVIQNKQYTQRFYEQNTNFLANGIDPYYYENTIVTDDIQDLSNQLCAGLTSDLDKVTAIHEWVTANIYYDYAALRSGNYPPLPAQVVFDTRKCVCSGYAIITQALCWAQDIPCAYICGGTTNGYHAWNVVELDGTWQWIDACWDTFNKYSYTGGETWTEDYQRNDYFLCPAEFISRDHWAQKAFAIDGINAILPQQSYQTVQNLVREEEERLKSNEYLIEMERALELDNTYSAWAEQEIMGAVKANLVPGILLNHFSSKITREEFCQLMVKLVEQKSGMEIGSYISARGKTISAPFVDTSMMEIKAAYTLGIVSGISDTEFNPYGSITRQEAAAMLERTAKLLGLTARNTVQFSDEGKIASWAKDSVAFVSGLTDPVSGYPVMGGMGDGTFAPSGAYTREQAIATTLRIFHCV